MSCRMGRWGRKDAHGGQRALFAAHMGDVRALRGGPSRTDAYILTGQSDKLSSGLPTGKGAVSRLHKKRTGSNFLPRCRETAGRGKATAQPKRPAAPE